MKGILKNIVRAVFRNYFSSVFTRSLKKTKDDQHVYVVDIDNTIADTWPSLKHYVYGNERERLLSLAVFTGMQKYVQELLADGNNVVFFLTARSYFSFVTTRSWLRSVGLEPRKGRLIIVHSAAEKLSFINRLLGRKGRITYIDDLSYNHERGEMKIYSEVISKLNGMPQVEYLGVSHIERINTKRNAEKAY